MCTTPFPIFGEIVENFDLIGVVKELGDNTFARREIVKEDERKLAQ